MEQGFKTEFYAKANYIKRVSDKLVVFQLSAFDFGWVNVSSRAFGDMVDVVSSLSDGVWVKGTAKLNNNSYTNKNGEKIEQLMLTIEDIFPAEEPPYKTKGSGNSASYSNKAKTYQPKEQAPRTLDTLDISDEDLPF